MGSLNDLTGKKVLVVHRDQNRADRSAQDILDRKGIPHIETDESKACEMLKLDSHGFFGVYFDGMLLDCIAGRDLLAVEVKREIEPRRRFA